MISNSKAQTRSSLSKDHKYSMTELNDILAPLNYVDRIKKIYEIYDAKDILVSSSFGTKSVLMLYLISQICPEQKIYFINTTYHFPETIGYKDYLTSLYNLNVIDVLPNEEENQLTLEQEWWKDHPRMCCTINKIAPFGPITKLHKVWITGLMSNQTDVRSRLNYIESKGDIRKIYPILDLNEELFQQEIEKHKLQRHPLEMDGFGSVGCKHCTIKGDGREGRWCKTDQTECGLHTSYFYKKQ